MTEAVTETRTVAIKGRDITVKRLGETQMLQLNHEAAILQRDDTSKERLLKGLDRVFRAFTSVVVNKEDSEYLQDLMADGELDLQELVQFITSFRTETAPTTGPVKVRRGRPPTKRT